MMSLMWENIPAPPAIVNVLRMYSTREALAKHSDVWTPDNVLSIEYPNESNIRCSPNLKSFFRLSNLDLTHVRKCSNPSCKRREAGPGPGNEANCCHPTQHIMLVQRSCVHFTTSWCCRTHVVYTLRWSEQVITFAPTHTHDIHDHTIVLSVYQSTNLSGTMYHVTITVVTDLYSSLLRFLRGEIARQNG